MQTCTSCGVVKPSEAFFFRNKNGNMRHKACKECYTKKRKNYYQAHYIKYGSLYRARAIERKARVRAGLRQKMLEYLSDKYCLHCGNSDPRVLDFDHIDVEKKSFNVAKGLGDLV